MSSGPTKPHNQDALSNALQHPPERYATSRRATERSSRSSAAASFQNVRRRQTYGSTINHPQSRGGNAGRPVQESYPSYNLAWEALKGFLEKKWPRATFVAQHIADHWVFDAPDYLTNEDRENIALLRIKTQRRPSVSDSE